ncbi:hypothetical protein SEA_LEWANDO_89 [Arthrobacter phage Lewando]|nr:hypothetical protein SEA_LEWANDO_89 [Arthrobacter phage Lewando]
MAQHMLTTHDNPYNPFTHYREWYRWDTDHGYHSAAYLARITITSDELSEADQELAIEQAITEILIEDPLLIYKRVTKESQEVSEV